MNNYDKQYHNLINEVLNKGTKKQSRNDKTLNLPSAMIVHDMSEGFPISTLRKIFYRGGFIEQLFFMSGETDTKILESKGINYWKGNTSREWLDSKNLIMLPEGDLGCGYSHQYRNFGGEHPKIPATKGLIGKDQLLEVYNKLRKNPNHRDIHIELWNPLQIQYMALPPCHHSIDFIATEETKELSLVFKMRSSDIIAGLPYNFIMYGFLLESMAKLIGYTPKQLTYFGSNVHIYNTNIDVAKEMLNRNPETYQLPILEIKKELSTLNDVIKLDYDNDLKVHNYKYYPSIKTIMVI